MDLILWRHTEAEDGSPDAQRKLTAKGRRQAKAMAAWLKTRLREPWTLLTSPLDRAQETARALSGKFNIVDEIATAADAAALLNAADWPDAQGTVVVVGHQPMLGRAAARLLCGKNADCSIKKGAVWWFRKRGNGVVLVAVMAPEML
jgi:phosphohistidine phosphatase